MRTLLIAVLVVQAPAQTPAEQPVSYVASIKLNNDVNPRGGSEYSPASGRLNATAVSVATLLRQAYRIQSYQLIGLPDRISRERYDVVAKADGSPAPPQQALLRALLRDRFRLSAHNETREMPIFTLVVARKDGGIGPQLTKSSFDCAAYLAGPHPPPEPGRTPPCATNIGPGVLHGKAISMATLATGLAPFVSRLTVDHTGLTGGYDAELTWTPESPNTPADASGTSIFTALQEQLGLKLVSEKGPVDVLVVDHIEEPSGN